MRRRISVSSSSQGLPESSRSAIADAAARDGYSLKDLSLRAVRGQDTPFEDPPSIYIKREGNRHKVASTFKMKTQ